MFSRFESIVYRSLLLAATTSGLPGCYLFNTGEWHDLKRIETSIPAVLQSEMRALRQSGAVIPKKQCKALCADVIKTHSGGDFTGCEWINPQPAILCPGTGLAVPLPTSATALATENPGQPISQQICEEACGNVQGQSTCTVSRPDSVLCMIHYHHPLQSGRRPKGLLDEGAPPGGAAAWFALCASLEAAAVVAFAELHEELVLLGAPAPLQRECLLALEDEQRHARLMTELARKGGAEPEPPQIRRVPARARLQLACDNAAEGCVRESFGAISALWQSVTSSDPVVRAAMAQIAKDETRHAELALSLDAWLSGLLNRVERQQVATARQTAYEELRHELGSTETTPDPILALPVGAQAQHLLDETMSELGRIWM